MNRLQLNKRVKDLNRVIRTARCFIKFQSSDNQSKDEQIAALNQSVTDLQSELEAAAAERDSARMMYCEYDNSTQTKQEFAVAQGWGYLYGIEPA